jgi:hypothetical protein
MSLFSFSDNWTELANRYPEEFVKEVERRYHLDRDWKIFSKITKEGNRADKSFSRKRCPIQPGEWIVMPYSPLRIANILKAIESGRLKEKVISP